MDFSFTIMRNWWSKRPSQFWIFALVKNSLGPSRDPLEGSRGSWGPFSGGLHWSARVCTGLQCLVGAKNWTKSKTKLKNVHLIEKTVNVKYFAPLLKKWSMRTWCQQKRKLTSAVHIGSMSQSSWSMSILTQLKHKSHPVKFCPVFQLAANQPLYS